MERKVFYPPDQQQLYDLIERIETNLKELRQLLTHYSAIPSKRRAKSLYGIFPRTRITLNDFREARQSWSRRIEKA
ncbi:MAG: hypothetical protein N2559_00340 [Anaerolineae bacterium]|nr:hypothetical protein [Anaerolineae bacterium]